MHLQTIQQREGKYGNVYYADIKSKNRKYPSPDMSFVDNVKPWLMKEHPDYVAWRSGVLFPEDSND